MKIPRTSRLFVSSVLLGTVVAVQTARGDAVTDGTLATEKIVADARLETPPACRVLAIVYTAAYEAANAITKRYPASPPRPEAVPGASVEAAIAAASRTTLTRLLPAQQAAIDGSYRAALAKIPDGAAKAAGIAVGEEAAAEVLAARVDDGAAAAESYRPLTTAGVYVPTVLPVVPQWPKRRPWLMTSPEQFRPAPPPALTSELWARDYDEIKAVGSRGSSRRTPEQTEMARFWKATFPSIYFGIVRSVAGAPGRDVTQNARLVAAASQAADDALISVFEAKYAYSFWRPITAIRNGDLDGNAATERDPSWTPFIDTPMHPEYPCAHCIVSGAIGTVLQAEIGDGPMPTLTTTSPTADDAARSWKTIDDLLREVANARIYDGVHYRNSTEVGTAMGRQIGALAVAKFRLRPDEPGPARAVTKED